MEGGGTNVHLNCSMLEPLHRYWLIVVCVLWGVGTEYFSHHCEEVVGNLRPLLGTTLEDEDEIIQVDINACDYVGAFLGIQGGPAGVVMCLLDPSVRSRSGVG